MALDFTTAQPLPSVVAQISSRTPIGSRLNSAEWAAVPAALRMRSMFSARVESERFLEEAQARILQRVAMARKDGVTMDRARFIVEMQDELRADGYIPDPDLVGGLQDLSSARRLGLIWDMNIAMAEGYGRWLSDQDPDMLAAAPAQELVRLEDRVDKRPWPAIWSENGGQFYGAPSADFPDAPGRMMALKNDIIWQKISEFDTPWPPFRWGSGVGLRNVRARDAIALGVMRANQLVKPLSVPFNSELKASLKGISQAGRNRIEDDLLGEVEIDGDEITLTPSIADYEAQAARKSEKVPNILDQLEAPDTIPELATALSAQVKVSPRLFTITKPDVVDAVETAIRKANEITKVTSEDTLTVQIRSKGIEFDPKTNRVVIGASAITPGMLTLVGLAQWLNHTQMHDRGSLVGLTATDRVPELLPVLEAIQSSVGYAKLKARAIRENRFELLEAQSLFAWAFAQFGASTNTLLMREWRMIRLGLTDLFPELTWTPLDFVQIRTAMQKFFQP